MLIEELPELIVEQQAIASQHLKKYVIADFYLPKNISDPRKLSLLIINDGQDLEELGLAEMLNRLFEAGEISPLVCVGLHTDKHRRQEYGTAGALDYMGRGNRSLQYQRFVTRELFSFLEHCYALNTFLHEGICGFSLGGLSALDTAWNHELLFSTVGVFSGSLWWRSHRVDDDYDDDQHRIMHQQIRRGTFKPGMRFYFTTGSLDETDDRNNNGIIDSIDDTLDLVKELKATGYTDDDIRYINFEDGRHDVETWKRAMPDFLRWGWGR